MKTALERHAAGEAVVIPVILRPVDWQATPFGAFQALPRDGKPVTTFENLDIALQQVASGIRAAIEKRIQPRRREIAPPVISPPASALSGSCLDLIAQSLTLYIGPIAGVVVRQAALRCRAPLELCEIVAAEIANPGDRQRFLKDAYTADRAGWPTLPTTAKPFAG
jgi:hypothetical protein